jgi:glycosyltransferase involved in cell wall biosynthesis
MEAGQRGYLRFDSLIKTLEDRNDSITSNDGKLYAIHRTLFAPIPEGVTDDLYVALGVTARGYRFRFAPAARAVIPPPVHSPGHEIRRRRRIVAQSLRGIFRMHSLLAVQKHGIFAIGLFINKIVRRLLPLLLPAWGCAALLLWQQHVFYALAALVLPSSILIALLYPFVETVPSRCQSTKNASLQYRSAHLLTRLSSVSAYFWLGHIGTLLGLLDALCRRTITKWEPEKNRERLPDRSVAYIMSRFPKITETFVLHEMISVLEHSIALAVYPLLREHESVSHPEIRRILPQVQYTAFISVAVLSANLRFFIQKPSAYLATLCILLTGTLRCPQTLFKTLAIFPKSVYLAHLARKRHIGHVHAHFATYPATAAFIMHRLTAIPFSFTAHAHDILMDRSLLAEKMKAAAFTVTISEFNQRLLARHDGFRSRIEIVRCGVNLSQFDPALRRRHPSSSCISLVCVASYKDMKGHTYLIEAFTLLREKGLAFTCHLIGDGPLKETIRSRIHQSKLEQQVIMHGSLAGPDVRRVLAAADIAVLPCVVGKRGDHDGIPVFLMEAMAMELPAVSTRLSGIPELIEDGHTGFLVPPGNSRALADALLLLAADPVLRRRMGKAARMQVKAHFDLDRNNARLVGLFDSSFPRRSAQETAE